MAQRNGTFIIKKSKFCFIHWLLIQKLIVCWGGASSNISCCIRAHNVFLMCTYLCLINLVILHLPKLIFVLPYLHYPNGLKVFVCGFFLFVVFVVYFTFLLFFPPTFSPAWSQLSAIIQQLSTGEGEGWYVLPLRQVKTVNHIFWTTAHHCVA